MSTGWDKYEPAPLEFLHGRVMNLFHEWRKENFQDGQITVPISGQVLSRIIGQAKVETYKKYPKQNLSEAILKTDM